MNETKKKFLIAGNRFLLKTHLRRPGFTYRGFERFNKVKERIQKFKDTGY